MAPELRYALELSAQVGGFLPGGDGLGGFLADAADLEQLRFGGAQDGRGIAEVFEQLPHADRADMLDQIQCHQGFVGLHTGGIAVSWKGGKRKQGEIRRPKPEGRKAACSGN